MLINQHLGEARKFHIWEMSGDSFKLVESRMAPQQCGGIKRWHQLAKILGDCRAVLTSSTDKTPCEILSKSGTKAVEAAVFIEDGLQTIYQNKKTKTLKGRTEPCSAGACSGSDGGCGKRL